ncbi:MAG: fused MFS/spermidine synthase, partial [Myxococcota bacterium]
MIRVIAILFLFSGATSLLYQVAWMRMLSLFFGSDLYAAAITLSVFMGGLSLGSWLAGLLGDRLRRPLLAYGALEILIGCYALAFPSLLNGLSDAYGQVYRAHFETAPWIYHGFRIAVASVTLLLPTLLMGATLPLIVRQIARSEGELGARVGHFYAVNTLGALLGTLGTGFWLLPWLGTSGSVRLALLVNLAIGSSAAIVAYRLGEIPRPGSAPAERSPASGPVPLRLRRTALVVVALSGFAALALEVVWTRVLVQSFSGTVYAFSIMLSCFLFGIFYGSRWAAAVVDRRPDLAGLLARLQLWLAAAVAALSVAIYVAPALFGSLVWGLTGLSGGAFGPASVVAQFAVASLLIVGPTILLGATFPVAVKLYTRDIEHRASGTGSVYSANTAGSVAGALAGGFALLPLLGTRSSLVAISTIHLAAGLLVLWVASRRVGEGSAGPALAARLAPLAVAGAAVAAWWLPPQTVINYNMQSTSRPEVVYHGEGVTHRVDIVRNDQGNTIMMINGNIEADTSLTQRRHFVLKGHLPLLLHREPRQVAVIGLGLGITLAATARNPAPERIRLVELSPQMVEAHRTIEDVTGSILDNPKIDLRIDDGRNFLAMSEESFDMITADPVHPRITGVGYLYTREYYQSIRARMNPGAVVTQWMPMYRISPESFDVAFRTFVEVFPNASFWYVRGHGLFVASDGPFVIGWPTLAERFAHPAVSRDLASIGIDSPEELLGHLLMDAEAIRAYLS